MAQNKTLTEEQPINRYNRPVPGHSLTDTPKVNLMKTLQCFQTQMKL